MHSVLGETKKGRLTSWDRSPTIEKFFRLGQIMPENVSNSSINRKLSSLKNKIYDAVQDRELVDSILNSRPRPFPSSSLWIKDPNKTMGDLVAYLKLNYCASGFTLVHVVAVLNHMEMDLTVNQE